VEAYRDAVDRQIADEQRKIQPLLAEIVEAADRRISAEEAFVKQRMSAKQFLIAMALITHRSVIGLAVFQGPSLSKSYIKDNRHDHERYLKITEEKTFRIYEQRPHLLRSVRRRWRVMRHLYVNTANGRRFAPKNTGFSCTTGTSRFSMLSYFVALLVRLVKEPLLGRWTTV